MPVLRQAFRRQLPCLGVWPLDFHDETPGANQLDPDNILKAGMACREICQQTQLDRRLNMGWLTGFPYKESLLKIPQIVPSDMLRIS